MDKNDPNPNLPKENSAKGRGEGGTCRGVEEEIKDVGLFTDTLQINTVHIRTLEAFPVR